MEDFSLTLNREKLIPCIYKSLISSYSALVSVRLLLVERGREESEKIRITEKGICFHCTLCLPVTVVMQPAKISMLLNFSLVGSSTLVLS